MLVGAYADANLGRCARRPGGTSPGVPVSRTAEWALVRLPPADNGGRAAVTEGFAIGFGWLMLFVLLGVLAYFLLRKPR
jgi:hypothetical protein